MHWLSKGHTHPRSPRGTQFGAVGKRDESFSRSGERAPWSLRVKAYCNWSLHCCATLSTLGKVGLPLFKICSIIGSS